MLAPVSIDKYIDHVWWWIHQSFEADRIAAMYGSYFDESAVDGGGPISAIGGLMLDRGQHYDLLVEWNRALVSCRFPKDFIHMKHFGNDGELADYDVDEKRKLLSKLAWIINDNKNISIGSTLNPEDYRYHLPKVFGNKPEITIHGVCFLLAATAQAKWANSQNYGVNYLD